MSLDMYPLISPNEARLDLVWKTLGVYQVGGAPKRAGMVIKKNIYVFLLSILHVFFLQLTM